VDLPSVDDLRAIFVAARENGITRLRLGELEFDRQAAPAPDLLDAINKAAPLPADEDPIAIIRGTVRPKAHAEPQDILEAMAAGQPIVGPISQPDPTVPQ
jgi:hypothetical protein